MRELEFSMMNHMQFAVSDVDIIKPFCPDVHVTKTLVIANIFRFLPTSLQLGFPLCSQNGFPGLVPSIYLPFIEVNYQSRGGDDEAVYSPIFNVVVLRFIARTHGVFSIVLAPSFAGPHTAGSLLSFNNHI